MNDIEKQLHEQYAINNNSNLSSVITLLVAMFAVFGAYGYVYLHSNSEFDYSDIWCLYKNGSYTLTALVLTALVTIIILGIMFHICLYQGVNQRLEQFVTFAIRYKLYFNKKLGENNDNIEELLNKIEIFPKNYHPFNKKCFEIVQGLFGEFLKIILIISFIILASLFLKFKYNAWCYFIISSVILGVLYFIDCHCVLKKYKKREWEYKEKLNLNKNVNQTIKK